jgi:hypothetical protein
MFLPELRLKFGDAKVRKGNVLPDTPVILAVEDEVLLQTLVHDALRQARQIREIDPAFPIVYITGAAADEWGSQGVPNSILLEKPFAPAQLVTAVSQLLNSGGTTT